MVVGVAGWRTGSGARCWLKKQCVASYNLYTYAFIYWCYLKVVTTVTVLLLVGVRREEERGRRIVSAISKKTPSEKMLSEKLAKYSPLIRDDKFIDEDEKTEKKTVLFFG